MRTFDRHFAERFCIEFGSAQWSGHSDQGIGGLLEVIYATARIRNQSITAINDCIVFLRNTTDDIREHSQANEIENTVPERPTAATPPLAAVCSCSLGVEVSS